MKLGKGHQSLGVLVVALLGVLLLGWAPAAAEDDLGGPPAPDQSAPTSSQADTTAATPSPVVVTGTVDTKMAEKWDSSETGGFKDLVVLSTTPTGTFSLSGLVLQAAGGSPVASATVSLKRTGGSSNVASATTNADGAFAFAGVPAPAGVTFDLEVVAAGFGSVNVTHQGLVAGETYEQTIYVETGARTDDASVLSRGATYLASSAALAYASDRRSPPQIRIGMYAQAIDCSASGPSYSVQTFPWRFYLLHVEAGELNSNWQGAAFKVNFASAQNYAWYYVQHPKSSTYDLTNTTSSQCFKPNRAIPTSWRRLVGGPANAFDPLENRLAEAAGGAIKATEYRAGTYNCVESLYPKNGNKLSQQGSRARYDQGCGDTSWQGIFNYYFTGSVEAQSAPPLPNTSWEPVVGGVKLSFPAQVGSGSLASNVGWRYQVDACMPDAAKPPCSWVTIYDRGWSSSRNTVPTSFTYSTALCLPYRTRAHNPSGWSGYATFGGGVCPG